MGNTKICFHVLDLCSIFNNRTINKIINNGRKKKCTPLNPFLKYSFQGIYSGFWQIIFPLINNIQQEEEEWDKSRTQNNKPYRKGIFDFCKFNPTRYY